MTTVKKYKVIIVGSGFSGLCMGIKLKQAGIHDFAILEKAEDLGGTWRENTYPGAECDIPSALYSFSFEHNADWEYKWSGQRQILKYQHDTANKHGLNQHLVYRQKVTAATFDEGLKSWIIETDTGDQYQAQHFVTAVGQLHHPSIPEFEGSELYEGERFHSAQWNHDVDLSGKRIGVIGNAASALQFIPEIAPAAKHITVFQRSPNWVVPKVDRAYKSWEQWLSDRFPVITKLYRFNLWLRGELIVLSAIRGNWISRAILRIWNWRALRKYIKDRKLRKKLTPDYPIGAKRILFSDNYYEALARDNVHLETTGIKSFTRSGILKKDGSHEDFDVIVYGTGFKTNPFLAEIDLVGRDGVAIRDAWNDGAHAYLGVSTHGFPNMYMMYGPNTNLGHNSIIIMIEAQAKYIMQCIQTMQRQNLSTIDVKAAAEQEYNDELQRRLASLAFAKVEQSWYMDGGKITNNWAGGTREYMRRLRNVNWEAYQAT